LLRQPNYAVTSAVTVGTCDLTNRFEGSIMGVWSGSASLTW
jgi:hypothetical protein